MIASILFGALILALAMAVQTIVLPALGVTALAPNLVLAAVMVMGLCCGKLPGLFAGLIPGLLLDILLTSGIGLYALPLTLLGYWAGALDNWAPEAWGIPPIIVGIGYVAMKGYEAVVQLLSQQMSAFTWAMLGRAAVCLIMTMAVTFLLYIFCHLFYERRRRRQTVINW